MKKRAILVLVAVLMISVLAFSLCACDDKDKNGNNNVDGNNENGIDFTGMTKEEIINLADTVTSFKYDYFEGKTHISEIIDLSDGLLKLKMDTYGNDERLYDELYRIEEKDGYEYIIRCIYSDEKEHTEYNRKKIESIPGISNHDVYSALLTAFSDFVVDGTKIILESSEDGDRMIYISEVNNTKWTLPEKYSNYKELAVEG